MFFKHALDLFSVLSFLCDIILILYIFDKFLITHHLLIYCIVFHFLLITKYNLRIPLETT